MSAPSPSGGSPCHRTATEESRTRVTARLYLSDASRSSSRSASAVSCVSTSSFVDRVNFMLELRTTQHCARQAAAGAQRPPPAPPPAPPPPPTLPAAAPRAVVIATADRKIVVVNLNNPSHIFNQTASPLKYQSRCIAAFPDHQGFCLGSIEGRVAVHHVNERDAQKNFAFKCHRENNDIYAVDDLKFHPTFGTFAEFRVQSLYQSKHE